MKCLKCDGELNPILKDGKSYAQCNKCGVLFTAHDLRNRPPQSQNTALFPTKTIPNESSSHEVVNMAHQVQKDTGKGKPYVVLQVVLKEKLIGTGSGNLTQLENVINKQVAKSYRLHTISTTSSGSTGWLGGDRIQATMIFEKI